MEPPDALLAFCNLLDHDKDLRLKVKTAKDPNRIIELAALGGHDFSLKELRFWSKELKAAYFPWAEMGDEWRRRFFQ